MKDALSALRELVQVAILTSAGERIGARNPTLHRPRLALYHSAAKASRTLRSLHVPVSSGVMLYCVGNHMLQDSYRKPQY